MVCVLNVLCVAVRRMADQREADGVPAWCWCRKDGVRWVMS